MGIEHVVVLGPLLGAIVAGLFQRVIGDRAAMAVTTGLLGAAAVGAIAIFAGLAFQDAPDRVLSLVPFVERFPFVEVGEFRSAWSIRIDMLSGVMLVVVTSVSFLVHLYSWGYMAEDPHRARFFAYLSFFTFAMLALVTANDLLQLFFGWEGVGLASYLLIGFWYEKRSANDAAIKAFVVNRVGDFGFALGIMACFAFYGTIEFAPLIEAVQAAPALAFTLPGGWTVPAIELAGVLLFIGAMGKSAQFFLHVWLPDAMEGPTPVSALIHAATMVTAGVFLVCRLSPLYELAPVSSALITVVGAVTAIYAATVGLAQNDIKRVVAYSTCSQLGYMFFAAGLGAYGAAMFHLFTHAFFKALLFLGAGSVIHGLHHEQDLRFMGGVRRAMPITWAMMLIGTLALIGFGIPGTPLGFAGFFSKDAIIETAYAGSLFGAPFAQFAFWVGVTAALLTSFYSWRLMFMAFEGKYRPNPDAHHDTAHGHGDEAAHGASHAHASHAHEAPHGAPSDPKAHASHAAPAHAAPAHESPAVMVAPLVALALGAIAAGVVFKPYFLTDQAAAFWGGSLVRASDPLYGPSGVHPYGAAEASGAGGHAEAAHAAPLPETAEHHDTDSHDAAESHGEAGGADHGGAHLPAWVAWAPFAVTVAGFLGAVVVYLLNPGMGGMLARAFGPLAAFLQRKWYFDELYNAIFVKGARALGDAFWKTGDRRVIDGLGPNGFAAAARFGAGLLRRLQTGYVYHYSFLMLAAAVAFGAYALYAAGLLPLGVAP